MILHSFIPGFVNLWSLAVIAIERWLFICKPLGNFIFKPDHALVCCLFTWLFALIASAPPLFGWKGLQCSCGPDWYITNNKYNNESYVMFLFGFCFTIPLATIIVCYGQLLITMKMQRLKMVVIMVFALWVVNNKVQPFDLRFATIPSFAKSSAVYNPVIYVLLNRQFHSCMMKMLGMIGGEDEESSMQSVTEVSRVGPV
uniref:Opsin 1 (cone pigments), short-wave-sensitive 2 n=1 Tax=Mastacembelus armatus TaxID=205130 RepID=A0A3Q3MZP5_9TELE